MTAPLDGTGGSGVAIRVRGNATADEIAALLAALARRPSTVDDAYERWRRGRIAALANGPVTPAGRPSPDR